MSATSSSASSRSTSFTATISLDCTSRALYTSPVAPRPTRAKRAYLSSIIIDASASIGVDAGGADMSTPDVEECGVERRRLVDVFCRLIDYYRLFQLLSRMFSLSKRSPIEALELSRGLGQ